MKTTDARTWRADDPRRLRMAETRAAILLAAGPIMLRDGLGGTTLDRVAAEGKIAKMTLYRHFPSKEALFQGVITAMCEAMRVAIEQAPHASAQRPAEERLADELHAFVTALLAPDALALYRLIVAESWRFPELGQVFDQSGMRVIRQRIAALLPADTQAHVAGEVVALTLGDAYQRAALGIAEEGDAAAFQRQIDVAVRHALGALA